MENLITLLTPKLFTNDARCDVNSTINDFDLHCSNAQFEDERWNFEIDGSFKFYGYIVMHKNVLLYIEKFPNGPFSYSPFDSATITIKPIKIEDLFLASLL